MRFEPTHYGDCADCGTRVSGTPATGAVNAMVVQAAPIPFLAEGNDCPHSRPDAAPLAVVTLTGPPAEFIEDPDLGSAFCTTCRRNVKVVDRFNDETLTRRGHEEYVATLLACGHSRCSVGRITGPAPGAPYAGPTVAVAASTASGDLRAARRLQDAGDGR